MLRRGRGAAGRSGGEGRGAGNGAEPERGPPRELPLCRVPFKASWPERGVGGAESGGGDLPQCFLGEVVRIWQVETSESVGRTTSPGRQRARPEPPRPWAGFGPPAPLAKLRPPPAEGRLPSEGRRWVRSCQGGRGAPGAPLRGRGPPWRLPYHERPSTPSLSVLICEMGPAT